MDDQARTARRGHRLDGLAKATGRAAYLDALRAAALGFPFATAVPVTSTIMRGPKRGCWLGRCGYCTPGELRRANGPVADPASRHHVTLCGPVAGLAPAERASALRSAR